MLFRFSNRDLLEEVEAGRFRRDLYHRISVTRIRVPPLRERESDIDLLTEHFNHSLAERHGVASRCFGPDVQALLRGYAWPGNVRELRNVVESLLLTSNDDTVRSDELPAELLAAGGAWVATTAAGSAANSAAQTDSPAPATSLEDAERLTIARTVKSVRGNLAQAARLLGISRSTLYRKVERYHLETGTRLDDAVD